MKKALALLVFLTTIYTFAQTKTVNNDDPKTFMNSITAEKLKKQLTIVASDEMEGRETGSKGQKRAGNYLVEQYKRCKISYPKGATNYYQAVPASFLNAKRNENLPDSENIWAYIEGSEKPDEVLVISAHYDHVGIKGGHVYNGADDDGSGTVAVLQIAEAFQKAKKAGLGP
jgi:acetylornithine deacetylase/succinyl-diaminopimelate desuccinylase-like protein